MDERNASKRAYWGAGRSREGWSNIVHRWSPEFGEMIHEMVYEARIVEEEERHKESKKLIDLALATADKETRVEAFRKGMIWGLPDDVLEILDRLTSKQELEPVSPADSESQSNSSI